MTQTFGRPEVFCEPQATDRLLVVAQKPSLLAAAYNLSWLRKTVLLIVLAAIWQIYATWLDNDLLFPTFSATIEALVDGVVSGVIPARVVVSLKVLFMGLGVGIVLATLLTAIAFRTRIGTDLLETLTAMFNPLPAIALLPLALIWFGLGVGGVVFVLVHSVIWAVSLNAHSGFNSVSNTLKMVGRNYELRGFAFFRQILIPAAFPSILAGLKIAWAFSWRTLIAAELVFGVSSSSGGLGWFIFESKNRLDIASVFAGLLTIIIIGLIIENVFFKVVEARTIRKWGMLA
ncbi:ABC transporter permease [Propylenella binzhouense]|uniref:ABC transporter permease subunit n=1 Tax=Propylenella binzhouense TaxID=2555902 RepID=A0A964T2V7_9HYPH|nr:ABC transporter permease subunit [Propylenella binzhouense]MYZ47289.1 ABC transporter permease subunit [Propylenella binzhouense]